MGQLYFLSGFREQGMYELQVSAKDVKFSIKTNYGNTPSNLAAMASSLSV